MSPTHMPKWGRAHVCKLEENICGNWSLTALQQGPGGVGRRLPLHAGLLTPSPENFWLKLLAGAMVVYADGPASVSEQKVWYQLDTFSIQFTQLQHGRCYQCSLLSDVSGVLLSQLCRTSTHGCNFRFLDVFGILRVGSWQPSVVRSVALSLGSTDGADPVSLSRLSEMSSSDSSLDSSPDVELSSSLSTTAMFCSGNSSLILSEINQSIKTSLCLQQARLACKMAF